MKCPKCNAQIEMIDVTAQRCRTCGYVPSPPPYVRDPLLTEATRGKPPAKSPACPKCGGDDLHESARAKGIVCIDCGYVKPAPPQEFNHVGPEVEHGSLFEGKFIANKPETPEQARDRAIERCMRACGWTQTVVPDELQCEIAGHIAGVWDAALEYMKGSGL